MRITAPNLRMPHPQNPQHSPDLVFVMSNHGYGVINVLPGVHGLCFEFSVTGILFPRGSESVLNWY